jgi:hypothetical protein
LVSLPSRRLNSVGAARAAPTSRKEKMASFIVASFCGKGVGWCFTQIFFFRGRVEIKHKEGRCFPRCPKKRQLL